MSRPMRERILTAAVSVMRERGVSGATTKEIARAAGVAEGSIYNHFANKTELVAASMAQVASGVRDAIMRLNGRVGEASVEHNLTELAEAQIRFYADLLPITGPVLGDRDLLDWLRRGGPHQGDGPPPGPAIGHAGVIGYLEAERAAGRLRADAESPYLAAALIGACQQYAFLALFSRPEVIAEVARLPADAAEYARGVVRSILAGNA